jgi:hypothetical protein
MQNIVKIKVHMQDGTNEQKATLLCKHLLSASTESVSRTGVMHCSSTDAGGMLEEDVTH